MAALSNADEYAFPDISDLENPDFEPEGPFFLSFAVEAGGPDRSPLTDSSPNLVYMCAPQQG